MKLLVFTAGLIGVLCFGTGYAVQPTDDSWLIGEWVDSSHKNKVIIDNALNVTFHNECRPSCIVLGPYPASGFSNNINSNKTQAFILYYKNKVGLVTISGTLANRHTLKVNDYTQYTPGNTRIDRFGSTVYHKAMK